MPVDYVHSLFLSSEESRLMTKLYLEDALKKIVALEGQRIGDIGTPDLVNKGVVGQIIEKAIGLDLSSDLLDFEDGELKSNKFLKGKPAETLAITQVGHVLSEIEADVSWPNSKVLKKINSFIFLPVHKDNPDPNEWKVGRATHFSKKLHSAQYRLLAEDYEAIASDIRQILMKKGQLHTLNGPNQFLQIRTKDSKDATGKYHPVKYKGVTLSDKNYAFYLRPKFLNSIIVTDD
jgi:DNA mismatch repair endonuclease MutH